MSKSSIQNTKFTRRTFSISNDEIKNIVSKFGTPIYIVDENTLRSKVSILKNSFSNYNGKTVIAYSIKSNFNPSIIKIFNDEGISFDLTSLGELYFFIHSGGNLNQVMYTSITEEENEFLEALKLGVNYFVIGSYNGLINLKSASESCQRTPYVLVRINPEINVDADISASFHMSKFGVPINNSTNDNAIYLINKIYDSNLLKFNGIHFHLGSQINDPSCFVKTIDLLNDLITKLQNIIPNFTLNVLDIGGGIPVEYNSSVPSPEYIGKIISDKLNKFIKTINLNPVLIIESGRYLSAESLILVSRIVNLKTYSDGQFLIVDAGYNLLLDSALMNQEYPIDIITKSKRMTYDNIKIGGRLCDTLDVFKIPFNKKYPSAHVNDLVIFRNAGAYSIVFNMPFHCQTKPSIVLRRTDKSVEVIRQSESIEDLFNTEGGNTILQI